MAYIHSKGACRPLLLASLITACHTSGAQTEDTPAAPALKDVVIRATPDGGAPRSALGGPAQVLSGDALRNRASSTLGATLQDEAGVHNASFGPGVGLPVVRGLSGERVKLILNGAGMHDASSLSADHAAMAESALAQRITILRGPATIAHGGQAMGGAIDIEDGRIPTRRPARLVPTLETRLKPHGHLGVIKLDGPVGAQGAWHADVHQRRQSRVNIPGLAIDEEAVRRQFYMVNARNTHGRIDNAQSHTEGGALGGNWFGESGRVGASISHLKQAYGIPAGGHSHQHAGTTPGDEHVHIQAAQTRYTLKGLLADLPGSWGEMNWQLTHVDYRHEELVGHTPQTRFENRVNEARATLDKAWDARWQTQIGAELGGRAFSALGQEAFVPPTRAQQAALFGTFRWQDQAQARWRWEGGARVERRLVAPVSAQHTAQGSIVTLPERHFDMGSLAIGLTRAHPGGELSLSRWLVSRAPEIQELYALGPHLATMTYEIGNSALQVETLRAWDLGLKQQIGRTRVQAHAFLYESERYIHQRTTGLFYDAEEELFRSLCARLDQCLPVTSHEQAPARLHGYEWQWQLPLLPGSQAWQLTLSGDMVQGRLANGEDLPRMPPRRWGLALRHEQGAWQGEVRAVRAGSQRRPGANEQPTDGYFQLHANLRWSQRQAQRRLSLFVSGRNLSNQEVRHSTSHLRLYAPEPGRTIEIGMEVTL